MKSKLPQIKYSTMHLTALQQLKNIAVRLLAYTSILFLCSFALAMPATAQITINEVMQANLHLKDDQNNLPESWIELFNNTDYTQLLNQLCEIRIAGGNSRALPQKSLVLSAPKDFRATTSSALSGTRNPTSLQCIPSCCATPATTFCCATCAMQRHKA